MRVSSNYSMEVLSAIENAQAQELVALRQLSTGRRVNQPSDDPVAAAALIQNQSRSDRTDQYLKNVDNITSMLQTIDSSLSSVGTALTRAITLGVQGANGTLSGSQRGSIAADVSGIRDQVLQVANLSFKGTYVFAGTASTTAPFALDANAPSGVQYKGNVGVNEVTIGDGRQIAVNVPGSQVFSQAGSDVFGSLQQLITSLQSGTTDDISNATTQLRTAFDYLTQQRVFYGNSLNQLSAAETSLEQDQVTIKSEQNSLVGVDLATAATKLANAQTAVNAGMAAAARALPQSLLDYLGAP